MCTKEAVGHILRNFLMLTEEEEEKHESASSHPMPTIPFLSGSSGSMLFVRSYDLHHCLLMPASTAPPPPRPDPPDGVFLGDAAAVPLPDELFGCCWIYFLYCQAMRSSPCDESSPPSFSSSFREDDVVALASAGRNCPTPPLGICVASHATFCPTVTPSAMK